MRDILRFNLFAIPLMLAAAVVGIFAAPVAAETLEPLAELLVDTIASAGKEMVDRPAATAIVGVAAILLYRGLAALAARAKTPVGKPALRIGAKLLGVLLGSEAEWRNRVVAKGTSDVDAIIEKKTLLNRLSKVNPLVKDEIEAARRRLLR